MVDLFKLLCYQAVYYAVKCIPARQQPRRLLLVKTDEIGDYMLIRNLLGAFRRSNAYGSHHITFVGNIAFRQLFEAFDARAADEAIWLDKLRFRRNLFYRFAILKRLRQAGFSDAVNLIYSRSFRMDDLLVAVSTSSNNIAMKTTDLPASAIERRLTPRRLYHRLEDAGEETVFDAIRNARFIYGILGMNPDPVTTRLAASVPPTNISLPRAYFVVVPGAGNRKKRWPTENFVAVARHLSLQYGLTPVICGSAADRQDTEPLSTALSGTAIDLADGSAIDLTGRTSLVGLLAVLKGAHCLISVDTGAVHLAAAVGCPVFGLFSGFHYGRFAPYPREMATHFFAIYPDSTEEKVRVGLLVPREVSMNLISEIPAEKVIRVIKTALQPVQGRELQID
ncbi:glycosyltransferase family 9 protein [Puia dinghuensis]|uniref:Lipopolysaccharide heptosyltransferase family protein n=1 Tax=Puia dinghuensis TaxID=1792502 RepID=A0A8J2UF06_9BACT|nr:glycosyltransferase family 9 protein [Puia dinghuensis]GGB06275.1 hypothetical protein GCM10011511_32110 [Puia dinghuensis]